jgi:hypothetical protein
MQVHRILDFPTLAAPGDVVLREIRRQLGSNGVRITRAGRDRIEFDGPGFLDSALSFSVARRRAATFSRGAVTLDPAAPSRVHLELRVAPMSWIPPALVAVLMVLGDFPAWMRAIMLLAMAGACGFNYVVGREIWEGWVTQAARRVQAP